MKQKHIAKMDWERIDIIEPRHIPYKYRDSAMQVIKNIQNTLHRDEIGEHEMWNSWLYGTPFEIAKVQKTVAVILASAELDNDTLQQIQALQEQQNQMNINNGIKQLMRNKQQLNKLKNVPLKSQPSVKEYLKQNGIMISKPMKVGKFFEIVKNLLVNFESIANVEEQLN